MLPFVVLIIQPQCEANLSLYGRIQTAEYLTRHPNKSKNQTAEFNHPAEYWSTIIPTWYITANFYSCQHITKGFLVFKWPGFPVFKLHSNTGPFGICHLFDHSNIKLVLYSDFKAIYNKNISLATLFGRLDGNLIFVWLLGRNKKDCRCVHCCSLAVSITNKWW